MLLLIYTIVYSASSHCGNMTGHACTLYGSRHFITTAKVVFLFLFDYFLLFLSPTVEFEDRLNAPRVECIPPSFNVSLQFIRMRLYGERERERESQADNVKIKYNRLSPRTPSNQLKRDSPFQHSSTHTHSHMWRRNPITLR